MSLAMTMVAAGLAAMLIIFGAVKLAVWLADRKASDPSSSWSESRDAAWDGSSAHPDGDGGGD